MSSKQLLHNVSRVRSGVVVHRADCVCARFMESKGFCDYYVQQRSEELPKRRGKIIRSQSAIVMDRLLDLVHKFVGKNRRSPLPLPFLKSSSTWFVQPFFIRPTILVRDSHVLRHEPFSARWKSQVETSLSRRANGRRRGFRTRRRNRSTNRARKFTRPVLKPNRYATQQCGQHSKKKIPRGRESLCTIPLWCDFFQNNRVVGFRVITVNIFSFYFFRFCFHRDNYTTSHCTGRPAANCALHVGFYCIFFFFSFIYRIDPARLSDSMAEHLRRIEYIKSNNRKTVITGERISSCWATNASLKAFKRPLYNSWLSGRTANRTLLRIPILFDVSERQI